MSKIAIITGTTRPGRVNLDVATWVLERATQRGDADYELVDIADFNLPILDEAMPAGYGQYAGDHTREFAAKIAEFDGFIFVTGEYNHSVPAALSNALSYLAAEWNNKAAGIVSYGSASGVRAAEHLRGILSELQIAHVQKTGMFSIFTDFDYPTFQPSDNGANSVDAMLEQVVVWTKAMETVRTELLIDA